MIKVKKIKQLFPQYVNANSKRLLSIFAHPDDETINIGGILAKAADEQIDTFVITLTKGGKGFALNKKITQKELKAKREKELKAAGKILGIKKIFCLDFPDGELYKNAKDIGKTLHRLLNQINPGVIITHDPSGITGHPDHIATSSVVTSLLMNSPISKHNLFYTVLGETMKKIAKKAGKRKINWKTMPNPTHLIDIKQYIKLKVKASLAHKTQSLSQSKPVSLTIWYSLFDKEYLHLVKYDSKYRFQLVSFRTKYFRFNPQVNKKLYETKS